ncbi:unnamed protein product [Lactuca saligna]|uniref:Uncharacterized protein n=1 Tax=Lactuca saligna TaxID=75948 RepID=A0AA35YTD4_LACSI|nr:unnamed protein product [Lactuca saligna]
MSDKSLARNLFPVRPSSGGRPSSLPDRSGLQRIPLTGGSVPGAISSPLPDPNGLPRIPLTGGSVPGARSSPLPDPSGLPRIHLTGGSVPGAKSSPLPDPSGLPRIPLTGGFVPGSGSSPLLDPSGLPRGGFVSGARSSPGPNGLPRIPLSGGLSRTSVRTTRSGFSGSSSMGDINTNMGLTDAIADTGVVQNVGNGIAYGYEMTDNNEDPASDFFYNGPEHENEHEHGHESVHEPESPMVQTPHYSGTHGGSNDADSNGSHRPFITRKGYKFGRQSIHRTIVKIFWQSINEPWITYKKIPKEVVTQMFERFRTQYRWDPNEEGLIREGFENTLKDRYRGRMRDAREASVKSARKAGHVIAEINDNFEILANYNPPEIHIDVWRPRHTGGSIGFEEHRLKLKQSTGEDPSFIDLYYKTHLTAESKKIYFGGDKEAQVDFVNETSRVAIESYNTALSQKYGDDTTQHNVNDPELWTQTQLLRKGGKRKGPIYGAGYSDLHFLMTGAYSYESTSTSADFAKSQQEVLLFT